jgi:hypothetical protein
MPEKRLNLDQVPLGSGSGGAGGSFTLVTSEAVSAGGGSHVEPTTTYSPVPGTSVGFTLNIDSEVFFEGFGSCISQGATELHNCQIGLRIDGAVLHDGQAFVRGQIAAPQGFKDLAGLKVSRAAALLAGAHTAELVIRKADPAGPPVPAELATSALYPAVLTAVRIDPIAAVGSLTKQEAINQSGGNFSTVSLTFVPIPSTLVTITLNSPQTVLLAAMVTKQSLFFAAENFGIRVTSPGPSVVDLAGVQHFSGNAGHSLDNGQTVVRAISLPAGIHTAEIVLKNIAGASGPALVSLDAVKPAILTAIYTNPEEIVKITSDLPTEVNPGDAGAVGISTEAARADHEHQAQGDVPVDTAKANVEGNSTFFARANHEHRTILEVEDGGVLTGSRPIINLIGATVVDDGGNDRVNITIPTPPTVVETVKWHVSGNLAIGTKLEGTWVAGRAGTITRVTFHRETAGGTGGSTIVDVHKQGVTIFTTQGNRPTITQASGSDQIDAHTDMDITSFAQDDKFTFDIDQIETGTAPVDGTLTMEVTYP